MHIESPINLLFYTLSKAIATIAITVIDGFRHLYQAGEEHQIPGSDLGRAAEPKENVLAHGGVNYLTLSFN